eukprot:g5674.t1
MQTKENIVNRIAEEIADLFQRRSSYIRNCQCSRHSCSNDITNFSCTTRLGNVESVCGEDCEGRNINFDCSDVRTPPNTDIRNLSPRVKESICLYSNLEPLMKQLVSEEDSSSLYFGGTDGVMRSYPASPRQRGVENGDAQLGQCRPYDPRIRPWFIGASTRPKDIVFVIDSSGSMNEPVDNAYSAETRWDITRRAVVSMLGTLAAFDYVNVVAFSDSANRIDNTSLLLQGRQNNLDYLVANVRTASADGQTNFDAGFREAFNILRRACTEDRERQSCSECQKVILFLTDGRDTSRTGGISATQMSENIEQYQQDLEQTTSKRAAIFTFSMGESADDSIPRQIACANNGSWSYIGPETDVLTAMNGYYHFLTNAGSGDSPVWTNPYEDDGGLGLITTVAKPVYSRGTRDLDGIFLGVVGLDVLLSNLEVPGIEYSDVLEEIIERSSTCNLTPQTPCQLQVNRNAYANRAICADNISPTNREASNRMDPTGGSTCYRGTRKFYKLFTDQVNWNQARQRCESDRGRLVVIESEDELAFVAGMSSPDGSWISARRSTSNHRVFEWTDQAVSNSLLQTSSASWGVGEPNNFNGVENCVHIDRRGISGNLNDESCATELTFICEYNSSRRCENTVPVPESGYFEIPPLSACVHEEESLADSGPSSTAEALSSGDVMCPLGEQKNSFDAICCEDCRADEEDDDEDDENDDNLVIILGTVLPGAFIIILIVCAIIYRRWRRVEQIVVFNNTK